MKQKISILGSTGSIGLQSLDIISKNKNSFIIYLLSIYTIVRIIAAIDHNNENKIN